MESAGGGPGLEVVPGVEKEGSPAFCDSPARGSRAMRTAAVSIALALAPLAYAADQPVPPWKENPPIVAVKKELYRKSPRPGAAALAAVWYVGPRLERLEWRGVEVLDDVHDD